jgi:hypothetical protein
MQREYNNYLFLSDNDQFYELQNTEDCILETYFNLWGAPTIAAVFFRMLVSLLVHTHYTFRSLREIVIKTAMEKILLRLTAPQKIVVIDATGCSPQK